MNEIWHEISGYGSKYLVSSTGNIKNKRGLRRAVKRKDGYLHAKFRLDGCEKMLMIHRLVAMAFLGPPEKTKEVNHKNGIRSDNRADNLEWVSHSENMKHRTMTLGYSVHGERNPKARLKENDVLFIRGFEQNTENMKFLMSKYELSWSSVNNIMKKRSWKNL